MKHASIALAFTLGTMGALLTGGCSSSEDDATPALGTTVDAGSAAPPSGDGGPSATPEAGSDGAASDAHAEATTPPPACTTKPFPTGCTVSATTLPAAGDFGTMGPYAVTIATVGNPRPTAPLPVSIYMPTGQTNVPVIFVGHAYGATKVAVYDDLMRHLASNGIAAVFAPYAAANSTNAERYADLWDGFIAATTAYASVFDLTRVGFIGHSFGAGATPEMARKGFVEKGWGGAGRFMFIMAPWYSWGTGYDTLPTDVRTVMQVYADDEANDHQIAVNDIWNKLPAGIEKRWLMLRSDACGSCGITAIHTVPASSQQTDTTPNTRLDDLDVWGVQRRILALAKYAFTGDVAARVVAYGEDTNMGAWVGCGGRAVRPIEASTSPITATCQSVIYPAAKRCANADPGVTCP